MRIISPFKDYYDCVQSQGQDLSLIYNRQPEEIISKTRVFSFVSLLNRWGSDIVSRVEVVGFCGHVHPVLKIHKPGDARVKPVLCYLIEEVDAFVEQHFKPLEIERYYADKRRSYWSERWTYTPHKALVAFFAEARQRAGDFVYLFDKAPVFRCREGRETTLTYNACLKEVEFYRQVDPFTAYQEIQMFWGGRAAPEKPIPKIDDKTLAAAKGFDKFSFRKDKK